MGLRKAVGLAECGAVVTVVSVAFGEGFETMRGVRQVRGAYARKLMGLEKWRLVFAATDVRRVNAQVQRDAAARGILCCRCDEPEAGDFSGGAVARLGPHRGVTMAVSTNGASPMMAVRICREADGLVDPVLTVWAELLVDWRKQAKAKVHDAAVRRGVLQRIAGDEMENILRRQGPAAAERQFAAWLAEAVGTTLAAGGSKNGARRTKRAALKPVKRARRAVRVPRQKAGRHAR